MITGGQAPDRRAAHEGASPPPLPLLAGDDARAWLRSRERATDSELSADAREIVQVVGRGGDRALLRYTERFDGVRPDPLRIPTERLRAALESVQAARVDALERARRNLERFHDPQRRTERRVTVEPGVEVWREFRPIRRVGLYVPGGRAAYPSSLLMTVVPARVAGCEEIAVCCPPGPDGAPPRSVLAAAALLEVDEVYALGGAQAIGALAHGTETVPAVDKIFGPGSARVNAAKLAVADRVEIDLPAGPSEVVVWCDAAADPVLAAAELLAQAEHDPAATCVAVVPDRGTGSAVREALRRRLERAPRREVAARSLERGAVLVADDGAAARRWIDELAPEHLVVLRSDAEDASGRIRSAGSVFLGPWTPVAAGDYASGTNHVLPTGGRARARGGLSVDDFGAWVQFQRLAREGLAALGPTVIELAEWEGLPAHAASVRVRLASPDDGRDAAPPDLPVRDRLREVGPYTTARSEHDGGVLLDANENPLGSLVPELGASLHRYPDPANARLKGGLAEWLGVPTDRLWVGNGSDEALDVLLRTLVEPGSAVVVPEPSYGVYRTRAAIHGAEVRAVPLDDAFDVDVEATLDAARGARLVLLASPNNPTGGLLSRDRILAVARRADAVVAVDEAYVEFAGRDSLVAEVAPDAHLAVLRTFSKAWGLAAARVGYLVAPPVLVRYLDRAALPYPLSSLAADAALGSLAKAVEMERRVTRIVEERSRLRRGLERLGLEALPSDANFLLFFVPRPGEVHDRLARRGVVVRDRSHLPRLAGGLRVSVGAPEENARFLDALSGALQ